MRREERREEKRGEERRREVREGIGSEGKMIVMIKR